MCSSHLLGAVVVEVSECGRVLVLPERLNVKLVEDQESLLVVNRLHNQEIIGT